MCESQLITDPLFAEAAAVNIIGFSQGGLYARVLVQTCPGIRWSSLVTLGSPHGGVEALPGCDDRGDPDVTLICKAVESFLALGVYSAVAQNNVVPAQYYRDPGRESVFEADKIYLARVNNLVEASASYKSQLLSLDHFAMWRFTEDTVVQPSESAHFAYQANGIGIIPLTEQRLYTADLLGLRELNETGRLFSGAISGAHMNFTLDWFSANVSPLLRGTSIKDAVAR